uniref:Uncharacterized protein n=1 Tax=Sapovirus Hu/Chiba/010658/2001 TaxID=255229 RepID=Q0E7Y8_9CALI|nr:hypothetical protein [Sapovirus Hu/Chiba/010658/2001]
MAPNHLKRLLTAIVRGLTRLAQLVRPHPTLLFLIRNNPMGPRSAWKWLSLLGQSNQMSLMQYATALQSIVLLLGTIECPRELILDLFHSIPTLIHTPATCQPCGQVGGEVSTSAFPSLALVFLQGVSLLLSSHRVLTRPQFVTQVSCLMLLLMHALWSRFHL